MNEYMHSMRKLEVVVLVEVVSLLFDAKPQVPNLNNVKSYEASFFH